MVVTQSQKGRFISFLLITVKVLIMAFLEDLVAVRLMISYEHFIESLLSSLCFIENFLDHGQVHVDVFHLHVGSASLCHIFKTVDNIFFVILL